MTSTNIVSMDQIAAIVRRALSTGVTVEIDGLGLFRKTPTGYCFHPRNQPKVFIAYAHEDSASANRLFEELTAAGFDPWMDTRKLLPGQNWARAIQNAIETSDFAIGCYSLQSAHKKGGFQTEIRFALEATRRLPLDEVFLLPVRLDDCDIPAEVARLIQYVDLFPDWPQGLSRILEIIRKQTPFGPREPVA